MKKSPILRHLSMVLAFSLLAQIVVAEIPPSDAQPRAPRPNIARDVVPSDAQPRTGRPRIARDVVPSDAQPRTGRPRIARDVVPSDAQPRTGRPRIARDVVPSDAQPRTGRPRIARDVVPSDAQPRSGSTKVPAISPFVGEVAVGVSLLITYGPQILAMAATVAALAAGVSAVMNTSKQSVSLVQSIGQRLKAMLQLLLGPLSVSSGMTKQGVDEMSSQLLSVTRFVTKSLNAPVGEVQGEINRSVSMSKDLESLCLRSKRLALKMDASSRATTRDLNRVVAGGEVQIFRDGAKNVAAFLGSQAQMKSGEFNQALRNSKATTRKLQGVQQKISAALKESGLSASEATLRDLGLSPAMLGKELIGARKYSMMSSRSLDKSGQNPSGVHTQILSLLSGMKSDLETFAKQNNISPAKLKRVMLSQKLSVSANVSLPASRQKRSVSNGLSKEIGFMVEELARMNAKNADRLQKAAGSKRASSTRLSAASKRDAGTNTKYRNMVSSYKEYISVMTSDPGNKEGIAAARDDFEAKQDLYQNSIK